MDSHHSPWEETPFFLGVLLLIAGGGIAVVGALELKAPEYSKLVIGLVGLVWGSVLIRVWLSREQRRERWKLARSEEGRHQDKDAETAPSKARRSRSRSP